MYTPPTTLCGTTTLAARAGISPVVLATVELALTGGRTARLQELKWNLDDFIIEDSTLADAVRHGSMHTYVMDLPSGKLQLEQYGSSFWTSSPLSVELRDPPVASPGDAKPRWRKRSHRFWPHVRGDPVPFVGQSHLHGADVYLFQTVDGEMVLHRVARFEQDVEDHYDDEERRGHAR